MVAGRARGELGKPLRNRRSIYGEAVRQPYELIKPVKRHAYDRRRGRFDSFQMAAVVIGSGQGRRGRTLSAAKLRMRQCNEQRLVIGIVGRRPAGDLTVTRQR